MSGKPESAIGRACHNRLLWRCRRGLLELDLVLEHFVVRHFDTLSAQQQEQFLILLDLPDNELLDMITGKIETKDEFRPLLDLLIAA
ncbi:FAD assembly factor SdhE [Ferriphaselus amnicola]|uniref:FAD assembly factor SdhE n=1 Tax=Ferriphaselus amnicola TaxID=1188319 RepID=A0A2Z6G9Z3_9PROT|nr:succinate dehydrogenase assembly factor 2 [Ferriphaselus amnicola]BBE50278.1 FAD assembly factor SdhE [Ferriphaselus amnicola]